MSVNQVTPDARLREEFGGVKAALLYCVDMRMNKAQSAKFLRIDKSTLKNRADRFHVDFPDGYATRDMRLIIEVGRERVTRLNRAGIFGRNTHKVGMR